MGAANSSEAGSKSEGPPVSCEAGSKNEAPVAPVSSETRPKGETPQYSSEIQPREASIEDSAETSCNDPKEPPDQSNVDGLKADEKNESTVSDAPTCKTASRECLDTGVHLKKSLGLWNGVGMSVGIMIGSGIFVSPKTVVQYTGSVGMALIVWVATGLVSMVGALCYAELGTTIPLNGGTYVFILEAFGPLPAFLTLWSKILISRPAGRAIVVLTFANYLIQAFLPDCSSPPYYAVRLLAAALLCIIIYINCMGLKLGTKIQDALSLTKVLALIIIIVAGVHHLARGHVEHYVDPMKNTVWDAASFATAFYSTLFAYGGWSSLTYLTEELKDPYRTMPRAIAISMGIVTVIYTLTNVAYYAVLTPAEILSSSAVAVTFGNRMLGVLAWIIAFFVACSTAGNTNGSIITHSRMVHAGARNGHIPQVLALIHIKHSTPVIAVVFSGLIPLALLTADNVGGLLTYTSFTNNLTNVVSVLGLLWLRYKEPDRPRPIKVWLGFPIIYLCASVFLTVMPVVRRPAEIAVGLGVIALGVIAYYLTVYLDAKPKFLTRFMDKMQFACQILFWCMPEKCE
ncbi:Y+L amino acid transporter 2-like [Cherax quadricarinatus]|uniref:Y+L amino acid transporter 2-like n=1 Tax=Cherax quadricarinatus TaxID=27406 RepID=UPI00387EB31F